MWRGSFDDCGRAQNKWLFNGNPRALDSACLDPQWQSAFHGQSSSGKCERTKQMTFQWQSRASQTLMLPTSWQAKAKMHWSILQCDAQEYSTFQQLWQWQCIGNNALGTLGENGCGSRAARTAHPPSSTQRIEVQWLQHTFGHQRGRNNCAFRSPALLRIDWCTLCHFKPSGQLTQGLCKVTFSSWDVIGLKTWQVWICGEA